MGRRSSRTITQTPVVTAGLYSAGDALGGLLTFENIVTGQGAGVIESIVLIDQAEQDDITDLVLFKQTFTATADNGAIAISAADSLNCIGTIPILAADYVDIGGTSVATIKNIQLRFKASDSRTIFGQLVTRGTPTYGATTDVQISVSVLQDS